MPRDAVDVWTELRRTPRILELIRAHEGPELHLQTVLRREFPEDVVRAALLLHELRVRAKVKFSRAGEMWFDRVGLEQSTSEAVAAHKARRFRGETWDLCCGIGGDALALAARGAVVAVDQSLLACRFAEWNAEACGVGERVQPLCADVATLSLPKRPIHIDPDRRAGRRGRSLRIEDMRPGPDFLEELMQTCPGGAIKLSPASNFTGKFPGCEIELISLDGECKEATVWFGELAAPDLWRATVLPA
ncbi:MAG: class I SAM-dependent methyltransferase, partial [Planctomycetaceae bacterium]